MMRLRMMMLRRRTDPKTGTHTLCEPRVEMHLDISEETLCARIYR